MRISDWSSDVCSSDLAKLLRRLVAAGKVRVDAQHVADAGQHLVDAPRRVAREDDEEVVVEQREETGVDLLGFSRQHDADYFEAFRQALEGDQLGQMDLAGAVDRKRTRLTSIHKCTP